MGKNKKNRPKLLKHHHLRAAGYLYKLETLTPEEKDEWENGRMIEHQGQQVKVESTDFDYFYKNLDTPHGKVLVKIYHVGGDFYWNGAKVTMSHFLERIEGREKENAKYNALQAQVKDTEAYSIEELPKYKGVPIKFEEGPLNGRSTQYDNKLPYYAVQVADSKGKPVMLRYKRKDFVTPDGSKYIYVFDQTF